MEEHNYHTPWGTEIDPDNNTDMGDYLYQLHDFIAWLGETTLAMISQEADCGYTPPARNGHWIAFDIAGKELKNFARLAGYDCTGTGEDKGEIGKVGTVKKA